MVLESHIHLAGTQLKARNDDTEHNVLINKTDPHYIPATSHVIAIAVELARQKGISTRAVLEKTNLSPEDLYTPNTEFNRFQEIITFENLLNLIDSDLLGLQIGRAIKVSCLGLPGYTMLVSDNVAEAVSCLVAFPLMLGWYFNIELHADDTSVTLQIRDYCYSEQLKQFSIDMALSSVLTLVEDLLGHSIKPSAIELTCPSATHRQKVANFLDCDVEYSAINSIRFNKQTFERRCPLANKISFKELYHQCERIEREWHLKASQDFVSQIKQLVLQSPNNYSMTTLAKKLWMTERTLRRRLKENHVNFQQLVNDVRYQEALRLLDNTETPISEIAEQLGYSDTASFRHAFKRWSGSAPREYRNNQLTSHEASEVTTE